ncbi:hypothetical protein ES708_27883 [subsurface metagenome]
MVKKEPEDKKLVRVGGSVMVGLPKKIRRALNMGVGDKLRMWPVGEEYILMEKIESVRGANTRFRS